MSWYGIAVVPMLMSVCAATAAGLPPSVQNLMQPGRARDVRVDPKPPIPHSAFFHSDIYTPEMAVPTDAVQLYYSRLTQDTAMYKSWAEKGYAAQAMVHSRYGTEFSGADAGQGGPETAQVDSVGRRYGVAFVHHNGGLATILVGPLDPDLQARMTAQYGPVVTIDYDYYRVPTAARTAAAKPFYSNPLAAGATAVGYDEPDYWAATGYSEAFKREWQAYYGEPWQAPNTSVGTRYKSEQLKTFMERRQIQGVLAGVKATNPSATRMLAMHSQINSQYGGFVGAYHDLTTIPELQEVIAEVWMGTSQIPTPIAGVREPHMFELAYLEYSSFRNLLRGTGKRLWFMMDPKEDMPNRTEDEYRQGFVPNLLGAMMFPEIDSYQPLIWPNRIYGNVSKGYETIVNTVTGALCDMWQYPYGQVESGSPGIATFVSDSMGFQRADPSPSNFDGFFGMTLPLVSKGVPVQVLSLDRAAESGYLDDYKVILVSYDYLKPLDPKQNEALAKWIMDGGSLVVFGGTDAYNAVKDSWWRKDGYASPVEHLFGELDLPIRSPKTLGPAEGTRRLRSPRNPEVGITAPAGYAITLYNPPAGANTIMQIDGEPGAAVWEADAGKGHVLYAGISPDFLAQTKQGAVWLRELTRNAMRAAGEKYEERPYFICRRGPFTSVRTLAEELPLTGRYVDLLSSDLKALDNPTIPANSHAFLADAGPMGNHPYLMAVSGRRRAVCETEKTTSVFVQAPASTNGVARIYAGAREPSEVKAFSVDGKELPAESTREGSTLLVRYPNQADGVVVRVVW